MANELTLSLAMRLTNGALSKSLQISSLRIDQTLAGAWESVVVVGTSEEDIVPVDITTLGWLFMRNLDDTNFAKYGPKSGGAMVAFGRIEAEEWAAMRLEPGITLRAIADTADVRLQCIVLED